MRLAAPASQMLAASSTNSCSLETAPKRDECLRFETGNWRIASNCRVHPNRIDIITLWSSIVRIASTQSTRKSTESILHKGTIDRNSPQLSIPCHDRRTRRKNDRASVLSLLPWRRWLNWEIVHWEIEEPGESKNNDADHRNAREPRFITGFD